MKNETRISDLLIKLKKINHIYQLVGKEQREKLFKNSKFLIDELTELGYKKEFIETLLIGGSDFLETLFKEKDLFTEKREELSSCESAEIIFG